MSSNQDVNRGPLWRMKGIWARVKPSIAGVWDVTRPVCIFRAEGSLEQDHGDL